MDRYLRQYFSFILFLCFIFALPKSFTEKIREKSVGIGALAYRAIGYTKKSKSDEVESLRLENSLLSSQIQEVGDFLTSEERIETQFKLLDSLKEKQEETSSFEEKSFFERRENLLLSRLKKQLMSLNGKVIYREPSFWSSAVWIDIGEKDNRALQEKIIDINSPVLVGNVIVGVVDLVAEKKSRVRLITDASVSVSVRAIRGAFQNKVLLDSMQQLSHQLSLREDLFFSSEEQKNTLNILSHLENNLKATVSEKYLAKGEIRGSSSPLWRSRQQTLKGMGFNYDFEDEEGPARDLRTGEPLRKKGTVEILLREGDILVTTGMDGIFPEGFEIAYIEEVEPLEEGAISYSIKAKSLAPCLDELRSVTVLAPLE